MRQVLLLLFCIIWACISNAKTNQPAAHIDMKLNFQGDSVFVIANYSHYRIKSDADSFYFLLGSDYQISSIEAKGYISHKVTQKQNDPLPYIIIYLDKTTRKDNVVDFSFKYVIDLKKNNFLLSEWIELGLDQLWFPGYNGLANNFTSTIEINNLYEGYSVFSYPHANVKYHSNGSIRITNNTPCPDVLLIAGYNMRKWENSSHKVKTIFFSGASVPDSVLISMNDKVEDIIEFYNETIFTSTALRDLRILLRNTTKDKLSYQFYRAGMVTTGRDFNSYGNLAHEIAHHWWNKGDYVKEPWINEGFSNYCMLLVLDRFDTATRNKTIASYSQASAGLGSVSRTQLFSMNAYPIYYMKSAIILWNLDKLIGRPKMIVFLTKLIEVKAYTWSAMMDVLEKVAGNDSRGIFSEWLKSE
jgi:hypothetical protein